MGYSQSIKGSNKSQLMLLGDQGFEKGVRPVQSGCFWIHEFWCIIVAEFRA